MKFTRSLLAVFFPIVFNFAYAHTQDTPAQWNSYIDARISSVRYYLFNETYFKYFSTRSLHNQNLRALDLGAGSGNEDIFLLQRGWDVTAIDSDPRSGQIIGLRSQGLQGQLHFEAKTFTQAKLQGLYDLVYSRAALPFGQKANLPRILHKVSEHMRANGVFAFTLFGPKGTFTKSGGDAYSVTPQYAKKLLRKNHFKITYFLRRNYDSTDVLGHPVHWDIYDIVALKQ